MSSAKFTREVLEVAIKDIIYDANQMLDSLKEEDTFEALEGVNRFADRIENSLDDIAFRLQDCDEY